jgi:hypothetical protein
MAASRHSKDSSRTSSSSHPSRIAVDPAELFGGRSIPKGARTLADELGNEDFYSDDDNSLPACTRGSNEWLEAESPHFDTLSAETKVLILQQQLITAQATAAFCENQAIVDRCERQELSNRYAFLRRKYVELEARAETPEPGDQAPPRPPTRWLLGSWAAVSSRYPALKPAETLLASGKIQDALNLLWCADPKSNSKLGLIQDKQYATNEERLYGWVLYATLSRLQGAVQFSIGELLRVLTYTHRFGEADTLWLIYFQLGMGYLMLNESEPAHALQCFAQAKGLPEYEQLNEQYFELAKKEWIRLPQGDKRRLPSDRFLQMTVGAKSEAAMRTVPSRERFHAPLLPHSSIPAIPMFRPERTSPNAQLALEAGSRPRAIVSHQITVSPQATASGVEELAISALKQGNGDATTPEPRRNESPVGLNKVESESLYTSPPVFGPQGRREYDSHFLGELPRKHAFHALSEIDEETSAPSEAGELYEKAELSREALKCHTQSYGLPAQSFSPASPSTPLETEVTSSENCPSPRMGSQATADANDQPYKVGTRLNRQTSNTFDPAQVPLPSSPPYSGAEGLQHLNNSPASSQVHDQAVVSSRISEDDNANGVYDMYQ